MFTLMIIFVVVMIMIILVVVKVPMCQAYDGHSRNEAVLVHRGEDAQAV